MAGQLLSPLLPWLFCGTLTWALDTSRQNAHGYGEATSSHEKVYVGWMLQPADSEKDNKAKQDGWETRPELPALPGASKLTPSA